MANNSFRDSVNSLGWSRRDPDFPVRTNNSSTETSFLSRLQSLNPFGQGGYVQLPTHNEGPGAPLPAPTRREEEEGFFALSRWDRMLIFGACNLGAAVCFMICFFLFPVLSLKPRKFAVLYQLASFTFHSPSPKPRFPLFTLYLSDPRTTRFDFPSRIPVLPCIATLPPLPFKPRSHYPGHSRCLAQATWSVGSVLFLLSWAVLMGPWSYARHLVSGSRLPFTAAYFGSIALTLYFAIGRQNLFLTLISSIFQLTALVWYLVSYFPMGSTGLQFMGRFGVSRVSAWVSG
ncbi:Protein transport protein SFT2 [Penicillium rolfsii]|nr:Protein transport protein SFT2 [Penicillium rolfsii]